MKTKIDSLQMKLQINQKYFMALASEKDLPLKRYGFELKKKQFRDGLSLRYGLQQKNLALECTYGEDSSLTRAPLWQRRLYSNAPQ